MGKHSFQGTGVSFGVEKKPRARKWTDRLYDGRIRVQCRDCFDAGLPTSSSMTVCQACKERAVIRRSEAARFKAMLRADEGS